MVDILILASIFIMAYLVSDALQECLDRLKRLEELARGWQVDADRIKAKKAEEERLIREEFARTHEKKLELLRADPNRPVGGAVRVEMVNGEWKEVE